MTIAGAYWIVEAVDLSQKKIYVKPTKKSLSKLWTGSGADVHTKIVKRMQKALTEDIQYSYLSESAADRLSRARMDAASSGIATANAIEAGPGTVLFIPWAGTRQMRAWQAIFQRKDVTRRAGITSVSQENAFCFRVITESDPKSFLNRLRAGVEGIENMEEGLDAKRIPPFDKYDSLLPESLLIKGYVHNRLGWE